MSESNDDRPNLAKLFGVELEPTQSDEYTNADVEDSMEPVAGDPIVLELDAGLTAKFLEMTRLEFAMNDVEDEVREKAAGLVAKRMLDAMKGNLDAIIQHPQVKVFDTEEEAAGYFANAALYAKLHSDFWHEVRHRSGSWNSFLSVRQGFRVVSTGKKYTV